MASRLLPKDPTLRQDSGETVDTQKKGQHRGIHPPLLHLPLWLDPVWALPVRDRVSERPHASSKPTLVRQNEIANRPDGPSITRQ
jgi:hypothetical protein